MKKITDEDREANIQRVLSWIRSDVVTSPDFRMARVGLSPHSGALTRAQEDEFVDAIRHATANRVHATKLLLYYACNRGSMRLVQFLLPTEGVDRVDPSRATPLTIAAYGGRVEIVQYLLAHASTGLSNQDLLFVIANAVGGGHTEMVEFLLKLADEDFDINASIGLDNPPNGNRWTCGSLLERAIREDGVEVVSALLSYGASGLHSTPDIVRCVSSLEMAQLLYNHGAIFSSEGGLQAAVQSIEDEDRTLLHFLLNHGADIRRVQYTTVKPFHTALSSGREGSVWDCGDGIADLLSVGSTSTV